jgi:hypothetical protein
VDLGHDEIRRDHADVHASARELDAQRIEEADQRVLARRVTGSLGHAGESREARDGDDESFGSLEVRQRQRGEPHGREIVHLEQALEDLEIGNRVEAAPHGDARIVDHDVDAAERLHRLADEPLAVLRVRDVGRDREGFPAGGTTLACERFETRCVARGDHQSRTARGERQGERTSDALRGAREHDSLARDFPHVRSFRMAHRRPRGPTRLHCAA